MMSATIPTQGRSFGSPEGIFEKDVSLHGYLGGCRRCEKEGGPSRRLAATPVERPRLRDPNQAS